MRANLLAWEIFVALLVGLVATSRNAVAQSRGDTIAVLQTLTTKFAAHDHGRIYLYSQMGDSKDYMATSEPDRQNQRKLIAMVAQGNSAVDVYEQLPRST
jgi:hypothetical protein